MCQLLGMNCNVPTDICFSFAGFSARGGQTDEHVDGWGIAFFEGDGCRMFLSRRSRNQTGHLAVRCRVSGVSFQRLQESKQHASDFGNLFAQDAVGVLG
jgi:hypothetical protein